MGSDNAFQLWYANGDSAWDQIETDMDAHPHLFTTSRDCDCYEIIEQPGCYSPIIHLQQTNGQQSSHLPFTAEMNEKGIISGDKIWRALKAAYQSNQIRIPLTIEGYK